MSYRAAASPSGMAKVRRKAALSLTPLSIDVDEGDSTFLTGKMTEASGPTQGKGVPGKTIRLFINGGEVSQATTTEDGSYSLTYNWETAGEYEYQVKYLGD